MRISDWSSDVCSSDLQAATSPMAASAQRVRISSLLARRYGRRTRRRGGVSFRSAIAGGGFPDQRDHVGDALRPVRSEEHTSELQSLMRISYAVFCLKKKKQQTKDSPRRSLYRQYMK